MKTFRRQLRQRRAGFTLVELMVSLVIGALVVASVFSLGGASARHLQEQQRIGITQRSVRMAMDRLRRDIARAGYMHVPSEMAPRVGRCQNIPRLRSVPAVWMQDQDGTGMTALAGANGPANGVTADRLRLIGNYSTGDQYQIASPDAAGNVIFLQMQWLAFQRSFVVGTGGARAVNTEQYANVFAPGRMLHIETIDGKHIFTTITGSRVDTTTAVVNISPGIPATGDCGYQEVRMGLATVLSEVEYSIMTAPTGSGLDARNINVVGANTVLMRQELDMGTRTPLAGTQQAVLEFAVNFDVDFFVDRNLTPGGPPNIVQEMDAVAQTTLLARPWTARSAVVSIAARTPEQDRRFPWPWAGARPAGTQLNRYQVFPGQPGAARVRSLTTEVTMPNMVPR